MVRLGFQSKHSLAVINMYTLDQEVKDLNPSPLKVVELKKLFVKASFS